MTKYSHKGFTPLEERRYSITKILYNVSSSNSAVRNPGFLKRGNLLTGFTLIEIMIVVAIIAIILAIAFPNYLKIGSISKKAICINNLKTIDTAIGQWAMENSVTDGVMPTDDIYNYIKNKTKLFCPSGGEYTLYPVGANPQVTCSSESEGHKLPE